MKYQFLFPRLIIPVFLVLLMMPLEAGKDANLVICNQPRPEICDGLDNDCDGVSDEDFPLKGKHCDSKDADLCARGVFRCLVNGSSLHCSGDEPAAEETKAVIKITAARDPNPNCPQEDHQPPKLKFISPRPGKVVGKLVEVIISAQDQKSGIKEVTLSANGQPIKHFTSPPYNVKIDTTKFSNSVLLLYATARDRGADHNLTEKAIGCPIDLLAPKVEIVSPIEKSLDQQFNFEVAVDEKHLQTVNLYLDGHKVHTCTSSPCKKTLDAGKLQFGYHFLNALAEDEAGNKEEAVKEVLIPDHERYSLQFEGEVSDYPSHNFPTKILQRRRDEENQKIITIKAYSHNRPISYWLSTPVNSQGIPKKIEENVLKKIYVFSDIKGRQIQFPLLEEPPDDSEYNPFFQMVEVVYPPGYPPDSIRSVDTLAQASQDMLSGFNLIATDRIICIDLVPASISLSGGQHLLAPRLQKFWFEEQLVYGYQYDGPGEQGELKTTSYTNTEGEVGYRIHKSELFQFTYGSKPIFGRNLVSSTYGDQDYSPIATRYYMDLKKVGAKESDIPTDTEDIPSEWLSSSALRDDRDLLIPRTPWQESESE